MGFCYCSLISIVANVTKHDINLTDLIESAC